MNIVTMNQTELPKRPTDLGTNLFDCKFMIHCLIYILLSSLRYKDPESFSHYTIFGHINHQGICRFAAKSRIMYKS